MAKIRRVSIGDSRLSDRARVLFKTLVEDYLVDGQPIGSGRLVQSSGVTLSSATVRNIMVDLETRGLVSSPHTSAGRLPTQRGLRFFVDSLISVQPLERSSLQLLKDTLSEDMTPKELVEQASNLLSEISQLAGLVTTPGPEQE